MNIEWDVHGADSTVAEIKVEHERIKEYVQDTLREGAEEGEKVMKGAVPHDTGLLMSSIQAGHLEYMPGGLGGGGTWQVELNVGQGVPYLNIVTEGSGIYGQRGQEIWAGAYGPSSKFVGPDWYTPIGAHAMKFHYQGRLMYRSSVKGQPAQDEWLIMGRMAVEMKVGERVEALDENI